jgi:hypothetical protein
MAAAAMPAVVIRPSAIIRLTRSLLILDQMLPGRRGVKWTLTRARPATRTCGVMLAEPTSPGIRVSRLDRRVATNVPRHAPPP